jgi:Protein of unknown function (DUF4231)
MTTGAQNPDSAPPHRASSTASGTASSVAFGAVSSAAEYSVVGPLPPLGRTSAASSTGDVVLDRAEFEIAWYQKHATTSRLSYCTIKLLQILLAAFVPVAAGLSAPKLVTGSLGGMVVVLEGVQQLFRFHDNWVRYRQTAEDMLREKYLYAASGGDYAGALNPRRLLAERIEALASRESHQWINLQNTQDTKDDDEKVRTVGQQRAAAEQVAPPTGAATAR